MKNILSRLNSIALKLLGTLSLEEIYQIIVEEATHLFSGTHGTIFLEKNGSFYRAYSSLPLELNIQPRKKGYVYRAFKQGTLFIVPREELTTIHPSMENTPTRTLIVIPLSYKGKSVGVLNLHSYSQDQFDEKEIETFKMFGSMASLAIQSARSHEETKNALEIRDFFIALAGHELRTPLTVINGYAGLLKNKIENNQPIEQKWIKQLVWESDRLTHLVHELLEINQVKTGKIQFDLHQYSLRDIINKAMSEFYITYPTRTIDIIDSSKIDSAYIIGDEHKLVRVIAGLLDNAAKFSSKDKNITIRFKIIKDSYVIIIKDAGKGIKKEELPNIFKEFYKAEDNTKEGMGLGLFLAQYIIKKHNGTITIQSEFNKGTAVTVVLPKIK